MVSPFAPHLGEECWKILGHDKTLAYEDWVVWDNDKCIDKTATVAVQVNGKLRAKITLPTDADEDMARKAAFGDAAIANFTNGKEIKKVIYVPSRIINIVVAK